MICVVSEMHSDASEQILEMFAGHKIAVEQRCLAKFGQARIAAAVDGDLDATVVLFDIG